MGRERSTRTRPELQVQGRVVKRVARFAELDLMRADEAQAAGIRRPSFAVDLLEWLDDGARLACATHWGPRVLVLDVATERVTAAIELGVPGAVALAAAPDTRRLAVATGSEVLATWSLVTASWEGTRGALACARPRLHWTPDGTCVAYLGERYDEQYIAHFIVGAHELRAGVDRWRHELDAVAAQLGLVGNTPISAGTSFAISPDGRSLELMLSHLEGYSTLRFHADTGAPERMRWASRREELSSCLRIGRGDEVLAVANSTDSWGAVVRSEFVRWDTRSGAMRWAIEHPGGWAVRLALDERWFVLWGELRGEGWVQVRSAREGALLGRFTLRGGGDRPVSAAISPDSQRLAVGTARGRVWVLALDEKARAALAG